MIRMIILFGILLASVYLGLWLHHDPGYVFIATHHWTIESTLWVSLIVLVLFTLIMHCLLVLGKHLLHFPAYWQQWHHKRRQHTAQKKT
jgi:HemY protein